MDKKLYLQNIGEVLQERKFEEYFSKPETPEENKEIPLTFKSHIDEMYLALQEHKRDKQPKILPLVEKDCVAGVLRDRGKTKADL